MKKAVLFISVTLFIATLTVTALSEGVIPYSANLNGHGFRHCRQKCRFVV